MKTRLEHINITVPDPKATAEMLSAIFGWHIRWEGAAKDDGLSIHVGEADSYVALYSPGTPLKEAENTYGRVNGLNHLGVAVDDLEAVEARVQQRGLTAYSHGDNEPGRRFYFDDENGLEIEVVQYD